MAQVRQQDEAYAVAAASCYAEHGLEVTRTIGGGVVIMDVADENGQLPAGLEEVLEAAAEDCNARVPLPDHRSSRTLDDASYQRVIESRECIIAHGYDVPEPPSAEVWKDSDPNLAWTPYIAMFDGPGPTIPQDELRSLMDACPQSGPTFYSEAPAQSEG